LKRTFFFLSYLRPNSYDIVDFYDRHTRKIQFTWGAGDSKKHPRIAHVDKTR
jgi:hypothetical protein